MVLLGGDEYEKGRVSKDPEAIKDFLGHLVTHFFTTEAILGDLTFSARLGQSLLKIKILLRVIVESTRT